MNFNFIKQAQKEKNVILNYLEFIKFEPVLKVRNQK